MTDSNEEDLYGDIEENPVFPVVKTDTAKRPPPTTSSRTRDESHPRSLVEEVSYLQDEISKLQRENKALKRNMGTLFRTATTELQRKDKEIQRLTTELDQMALRK